MLTRFLVIGSAVLAASCANPHMLKPDVGPDQLSGQGVVVLRAYNPHPGLLCLVIIELGDCEHYVTWAYVEDGLVKRKNRDLELYTDSQDVVALVARPGTYALEFIAASGSTITSNPLQRMGDELPPRPDAQFKVVEGEVTYVGDLEIEIMPRTFQFSLHDKYEDAIAFMKTRYPAFAASLQKRLMKVRE